MTLRCAAVINAPMNKGAHPAYSYEISKAALNDFDGARL